MRALRHERGWAQDDFAARAGLHRTYVSSVELGKRNVALDNIGKIADALGVPIRDLFPAD